MCVCVCVCVCDVICGHVLLITGQWPLTTVFVCALPDIELPLSICTTALPPLHALNTSLSLCVAGCACRLIDFVYVLME